MLGLLHVRLSESPRGADRTACEGAVLESLQVSSYYSAEIPQMIDHLWLFPCRRYNWTDSPETVLPLISYLISNDVRVWLFRYANINDKCICTAKMADCVVSGSLCHITLMQWRCGWNPANAWNQVRHKCTEASGSDRLASLVHRLSGKLADTVFKQLFPESKFPRVQYIYFFRCCRLEGM